MIFRPTKRAEIKRTKKIARKRKKRNFAMPAAAPAMKPKPKAPATSAISAEMRAHFSMGGQTEVAGGRSGAGASCQGRDGWQFAGIQR